MSTHPKTKERLAQFKIKSDGDVRFLEPFGFFDFIHLEKKARCVLSDSGTVQEECAIFRMPNVTLRDVTERPETVECGSNVLTGCDASNILRCVEDAIATEPNWDPPKEYLVPDVSDVVLKLVLGEHDFLPEGLG